MDTDKIHGGKREGAGRKSSGREKTNFYITPAEAKICRDIIEQIRLNTTPQKQESAVRIEEQTELDFSKLESNYEEEICELKYQHENQISELKIEFEEEIKELNVRFKKQIEELKSDHREEISTLENDIIFYTDEVNTLKTELVELKNKKPEPFFMKYNTTVDAVDAVDAVENVETSVCDKIQTVATDERIMELYNLNLGMKKGRNEFIANSLNKKSELTRSGSLWTAENIKKNLQRIRKSQTFQILSPAGDVHD